MELAPLVLFVYNRPDHTSRTLAAISKLKLIGETDVFVFSDGPKNNATKDTLEKINEVRKIINDFTSSKSTTIFTAKENKGLAQSIIEGVSKIFQKYSKIIVLEDDLTPGENLLTYMNNALFFYEECEEVMQISAYDFPVNSGKFPEKTYFSPLTTTWGWATWARTWKGIDFACFGYENLKYDADLKNRFNIDNSYAYSDMLLQQMEGEKGISSWGIRFYWNVFKSNGLVLYPGYPLVLNKGWDGSGTHGDNYELFPVNNWNDKYSPQILDIDLSIDLDKLRALSIYLLKRISIKNKIISKVKIFLRRLTNFHE